MRLCKVFTMLFLLFLWSDSMGQGNPFLSGTEDDGELIQERSLLSGSIFSGLLRASADFQRNLQESISGTMQDVREKGDLGSLFVLLGASFVFGFVHVMGPGHRKMLLMGYFVGEGAKPLLGMLAGVLLALVHAGSAIILVGGFYLLTSRSILLSVGQAERILYPVTYGIILLLGGWMIYKGVRSYRTGGGGRTDAKGLGGLVLSGMVPCPGASAIMILAVTSNALLLGVLSVLAMSAGMGVFLAGLGLLSIYFRKGISGILKRGGRERKLDLVLHLAGGVLMVLFGAFLLAGSLLG